MFNRSFLIGVICLSSLNSFSETFSVTVEGSGGFTSIGDAVEAALSNNEADTIEIGPGTFTNTNSDGEVFTIVGEDDITIRGTDPANRPIILIEPNLSEEFLPVERFDGIVIQMAGTIRFENLIFLPTENFSIEPDVADMIAFKDHGTAENPSTLDAFFDNVLITHSNANNEPVTTTGFEDPTIESFNTPPEDGISFHVREPEAVDPFSGKLNDFANLTLENTIIAITSSNGGQGLDYAVPNGVLTILEGCVFSYGANITVQNRDYAKSVIKGTEENPVIFLRSNGSRPVNIWDGENEWEHVWVVGKEFPEDINFRFTASSGGPRLETRADSLIARNCIFANFWVNAVWGAYRFNSAGDANAVPDPSGLAPREYTFEHCTFFNVPIVHVIGDPNSDPQPVPSEVIYRDCIFDTNGVPTANGLPIPGVELLPTNPVFVHHPQALLGVELNTSFEVDTTAHNAAALFSDVSPDAQVSSSGNLIESVNFGFKETVLTPETMRDYLVPTNESVLNGQASDGTALDGARTGDFVTPVNDWQLF